MENDFYMCKTTHSGSFLSVLRTLNIPVFYKDLYIHKICVTLNHFTTCDLPVHFHLISQQEL